MADTTEVIQGNDGTGSENQEKTFTQEEVNRMISERVGREKAKYADYETLKEKAGKYDTQQEAGKTELQKATERAEKAEKNLRELQEQTAAKAVRAKVAAEMGVPEAALTGSDEETCKAQAKILVDYFKPGSYPDVKDGGESNRSGKKTSEEEFGNWFDKLF